MQFLNERSYARLGQLYIKGLYRNGVRCDKYRHSLFGDIDPTPSPQYNARINLSHAILLNAFGGFSGLKVGLTNYYSNRISPSFVRDYVREPDVLITNSITTLHAFQNAKFTKPIKYIPPPLDLEFWSRTQNRPIPNFISDREKFYFSAVGSLDPMEGLDVLLEAFISEFSSDDPVALILRCDLTNHLEPALNLRFWIDCIINELNKLQPPTIIILDKKIPDIRDLYRVTDCIVTCARFDCIGYSILEALASNTRVLSPIHSNLFGLRREIDMCGDRIPSSPLHGRFICDGSKGPFDFVKVATGDTWYECDLEATKFMMRRTFEIGKVENAVNVDLSKFDLYSCSKQLLDTVHDYA